MVTIPASLISVGQGSKTSTISASYITKTGLLTILGTSITDGHGWIQISNGSFTSQAGPETPFISCIAGVNKNKSFSVTCHNVSVINAISILPFNIGN